MNELCCGEMISNAWKEDIMDIHVEIFSHILMCSIVENL
jgi:hypothetical protein